MFGANALLGKLYDPVAFLGICTGFLAYQFGTLGTWNRFQSITEIITNKKTHKHALNVLRGQTIADVAKAAENPKTANAETITIPL